MTDTPTLAQAAAIVADAEKTALQTILDKATAFRADLLALVEALSFPTGYVSQPKTIAQGMIGNLGYPIDTQLPGLINSYGSANLTPPAA